MELNFKKYKETSKIILKEKNSNYKIVYILLSIIFLITVILSLVAKGSNELSPFISENFFNLEIFLLMIFPFFYILLFFDFYSNLNESRVMKKLLSEPISYKDLYFTGLYFLLYFGLIITLIIIVPESIISYAIADQRSFIMFLRSISVGIPIYLSILFWGLISLTVSSLTKKDMTSITVNFLIFIIINFVLLNLLENLITGLGSLLGFNEKEINSIIPFINSLYPFFSISNAISILTNPFLSFSFSNGINYYSGYFIGKQLGFLTSIQYSIYSILPLVLYIFILFILLFWSLKRLGFNY